jgi:hypothetical protein
MSWDPGTATLGTGAPDDAGEFHLELHPVDSNGMWSIHPVVLKVLYEDLTNFFGHLVATTYSGDISRGVLIEKDGSDLIYYRGTTDSDTTPQYGTDGTTFTSDALASSGDGVYGMDVSDQGILIAAGDTNLKRRISGVWDYASVGQGPGDVLWLPPFNAFLIHKGGVSPGDANTRFYLVDSEGVGPTTVYTEALVTKHYLSLVPTHGVVLALPYGETKTQYYLVNMLPDSTDPDVTSLTLPNAVDSTFGVACLPNGHVWVCLDSQTGTQHILTSQNGGHVFEVILDINSVIPGADASADNVVKFLAYHPVWDELIVGIYNTGTSLYKTFVSYNLGLSFEEATINTGGDASIVVPDRVRWSPLLGALYGSKGLNIWYTSTGSLELA